MFVYTFPSGLNVAVDEHEIKHAIKSASFWASETQDGFWDVHLTDRVWFENIRAESSFEAVEIARSLIKSDVSSETNEEVRRREVVTANTILTRILMGFCGNVRKSRNLA